MARQLFLVKLEAELLRIELLPEDHAVVILADSRAARTYVSKPTQVLTFRAGGPKSDRAGFHLA